MRLSKEVRVRDKAITVFELTVRDVKALWKHITGTSPETTGKTIFNNEKIMEEYWDKCVHGIALSETDDLTPSEMKTIYDAFMEVNAVFFDLALQLEGENPMLKALRLTIVADLMLRYAALSQEDTSEHGTMDTPSS